MPFIARNEMRSQIGNWSSLTIIDTFYKFIAFNISVIRHIIMLESCCEVLVLCIDRIWNWLMNFRFLWRLQAQAYNLIKCPDSLQFWRYSFMWEKKKILWKAWKKNSKGIWADPKNDPLCEMKMWVMLKAKNSKVKEGVSCLNNWWDAMTSWCNTFVNPV